MSARMVPSIKLETPKTLALSFIERNPSVFNIDKTVYIQRTNSLNPNRYEPSMVPHYRSTRRLDRGRTHERARLRPAREYHYWCHRRGDRRVYFFPPRYRHLWSPR